MILVVEMERRSDEGRLRAAASQDQGKCYPFNMTYERYLKVVKVKVGVKLIQYARRTYIRIYL